VRAEDDFAEALRADAKRPRGPRAERAAAETRESEGHAGKAEAQRDEADGAAAERAEAECIVVEQGATDVVPVQIVQSVCGANFEPIQADFAEEQLARAESVAGACAEVAHLATEAHRSEAQPAGDQVNMAQPFALVRSGAEHFETRHIVADGVEATRDQVERIESECVAGEGGPTKRFVRERREGQRMESDGTRALRVEAERAEAMCAEDDVELAVAERSQLERAEAEDFAAQRLEAKCDQTQRMMEQCAQAQRAEVLREATERARFEEQRREAQESYARAAAAERMAVAERGAAAERWVVERSRRQALVAQYLTENGFTQGVAGSKRRAFRRTTYPLHAAAKAGNAAMVDLLLQEGAPLAQLNSAGKTALQVAQKLNRRGSHVEAIKVLNSWLQCN